jgi:hypothetical protein
MFAKIVAAALMLGAASPACAQDSDIQARIVVALTGTAPVTVVSGHPDRDTRPLQDRIVAAVTGADLTWRASANAPVDMQAAIARAIH